MYCPCIVPLISVTNNVEVDELTQATQQFDEAVGKYLQKFEKHEKTICWCTGTQINTLCV